MIENLTKMPGIHAVSGQENQSTGSLPLQELAGTALMRMSTDEFRYRDAIHTDLANISVSEQMLEVLPPNARVQLAAINSNARTSCVGTAPPCLNAFESQTLATVLDQGARLTLGLQDNLACAAQQMADASRHPRAERKLARRLLRRLSSTLREQLHQWEPWVSPNNFIKLTAKSILLDFFADHQLRTELKNVPGEGGDEWSGLKEIKDVVRRQQRGLQTRPRVHSEDADQFVQASEARMLILRERYNLLKDLFDTATKSVDDTTTPEVLAKAVIHIVYALDACVEGIMAIMWRMDVYGYDTSISDNAVSLLDQWVVAKSLRIQGENVSLSWLKESILNPAMCGPSRPHLYGVEYNTSLALGLCASRMRDQSAAKNLMERILDPLKKRLSHFERLDATDEDAAKEASTLNEALADFQHALCPRISPQSRRRLEKIRSRLQELAVGGGLTEEAKIHLRTHIAHLAKTFQQGFEVQCASAL